MGDALGEPVVVIEGLAVLVKDTVSEKDALELRVPNATEKLGEREGVVLGVPKVDTELELDEV